MESRQVHFCNYQELSVAYTEKRQTQRSQRNIFWYVLSILEYLKQCSINNLINDLKHRQQQLNLYDRLNFSFKRIYPLLSALYNVQRRRLLILKTF